MVRQAKWNYEDARTYVEIPRGKGSVLRISVVEVTYSAGELEYWVDVRKMSGDAPGKGIALKLSEIREVAAVLNEIFEDKKAEYKDEPGTVEEE